MDANDDIELAPADFLENERVFVDNSDVIIEALVQNEDHLVDERTQIFVVRAPHIYHPFVVDFFFVLSSDEPNRTCALRNRPIDDWPTDCMDVPVLLKHFNYRPPLVN